MARLVNQLTTPKGDRPDCIIVLIGIARTSVVLGCILSP